MKKTYTREQIKNFYDARKMQIDAKITKITPSNQLHRSSGNTFEAKITHSLFCLYAQVEDDAYDPNWKSRENGHAWLSYDQSENVFVYDTRKRDDDWSETLIDNILDRNQSARVEKWIEFLSSIEYEENMETACSYYNLQGSYFGSIRNKFHSTGVVSEYEYSRLVRNKYTTKVITAKRSEPKFAVGSLVCFRATHEETTNEEGTHKCWKRDQTGNGILVLSNTAPIISACAGAKRYKAVVVGDTETFYIEERHIKKKRKLKVNKS